MYILIKHKPSKEDIAAFNMKVSEEDTTLDYRVELASLDQAAKEAFCEHYNLQPASIENTASVTLYYLTEV